MTQLYDEIGIGYRNYRRPDPRLATAILRALGEADTVVNVGGWCGVLRTNRPLRGGRRALAGDDSSAGGSTRPYHFGEFDLLAVSMQPSTNMWDRFMYTVADWLLPSRTHPSELLKFQPVATAPNHDWTDDFRTAVAWLRSGLEKTIDSQ